MDLSLTPVPKSINMGGDGFSIVRFERTRVPREQQLPPPVESRPQETDSALTEDARNSPPCTLCVRWPLHRHRCERALGSLPSPHHCTTTEYLTHILRPPHGDRHRVMVVARPTPAPWPTLWVAPRRLAAAPTPSIHMPLQPLSLPSYTQYNRKAGTPTRC